MSTAHASFQQIGTRSHQCDATATRQTADGGRAYVLSDGIGSDPEVLAWTRKITQRLAVLAARTLEPSTAITQVQYEITNEPGWDDIVPGACAVVAVTGPDKLLRVGWIGDCRAYLLHPDGHLARLTADHNQRAEFEAAGQKAPWWARNVVTRCMGHPQAGEALEPDWTAVHDRSGTRLLLASDGCYEPIEDAGLDLAADLALYDAPSEAAKHMVLSAIAAGGDRKDNATCLVADLA
jgi:serine/threonine protein phosphatase PrpC